MSAPAVWWVLHDAPGLPSHLVGTLTSIASHANEDGTGSRPFVETIASEARKKVRQVHDDIKALLRLNLLIVSPDQTAAMKFRADKRPVVYDLPIWLRRDDQPVAGCTTPHAVDRTSRSERGAPERQTGCGTASSDVRQSADSERRKKTEQASSSARASYRQRIADVASVETDDEIDQIIEHIRKAANGPIRNGLGAYIRTFTDDDIRDHADAVRVGSAERSEAARRAELEAARKWAEHQSKCKHDIPGGWLIRPHHNDPYCSICRNIDYARDTDAYLAATMARMNEEGIQ